MKVMLVPSALPGSSRQYLTTFLIGDTVAIDAGSLGFFGTPADQSRVQHVFLTHTHLDHIASLPIFLENVSNDSQHCPTIHATPEVLDVVCRDVLNDRLFPDFVRLSKDGPALVKLEPINPFHPICLENLCVQAVPLNHVVPTVGYMIDDGAAAIAIVTDTAPSDAIWELCNRTPNLKAIFLEVTFPESMAWLADASKHLTPSLFAGEVRKLQRSIPIYAIHLKARFVDQVIQEVRALKLPNVALLEPGRVMEIE
jgi:ribonuclease BN (tRNA processing enzyme)